MCSALLCGREARRVLNPNQSLPHKPRCGTRAPPRQRYCRTTRTTVRRLTSSLCMRGRMVGRRPCVHVHKSALTALRVFVRSYGPAITLRCIPSVFAAPSCGQVRAICFAVAFARAESRQESSRWFEAAWNGLYENQTAGCVAYGPPGPIRRPQGHLSQLAPAKSRHTCIHRTTVSCTR